MRGSPNHFPDCANRCPRRLRKASPVLHPIGGATPFARVERHRALMGVPSDQLARSSDRAAFRGSSECGLAPVTRFNQEPYGPCRKFGGEVSQHPRCGLVFVTCGLELALRPAQQFPGSNFSRQSVRSQATGAQSPQPRGHQ
jgi:hypothetical protein